MLAEIVREKFLQGLRIFVNDGYEIWTHQEVQQAILKTNI